jgi:hypothetical protein
VKEDHGIVLNDVNLEDYAQYYYHSHYTYEYGRYPQRTNGTHGLRPLPPGTAPMRQTIPAGRGSSFSLRLRYSSRVELGFDLGSRTIAGKVYDFQTKKLLPQVTVGVRTIGTEESFEAVTDASGTYVVADAPAAVYSFTLKSGVLEVPVKERMDLRVSMPFILESCFELDAEKKRASVRTECRSGFVEEARVATIGPHRLLLPDWFQEAGGGRPAVRAHGDRASRDRVPHSRSLSSSGCRDSAGRPGADVPGLLPLGQVP